MDGNQQGVTDGWVVSMNILFLPNKLHSIVDETSPVGTITFILTGGTT